MEGTSQSNIPLKSESENSSKNGKICATGRGPINIALIKYWGKENEEDIIPLNNSISITLDMESAYTETYAELEITGDNKNTLILNGKEEKISGRVSKIIKFFREKSRSVNKYYENANLHIKSLNSFPTAAGCASSASSMACLVKVLSKIFLNETLDTYELSHLARLGSGSACRSVWGGFVEWEKHSEKYNTSIAVQLADENHWTDINLLLLTVSDKRKDTSSTDGMKISKETSEFLNYRVNNILPKRLEQMRKAIADKNFDSLCELTIKDSNSFHAVCRDTFPTIIYMNDTSNFIVKCVEKINSHFGKWICAYTFDAGPNAFLIVQKENIEVVKFIFTSIFGLEIENSISTSISSDLKDLINNIKEAREVLGAAISKITHFKVGKGAYLI